MNNHECISIRNVSDGIVNVVATDADIETLIGFLEITKRHLDNSRARRTPASTPGPCNGECMGDPSNCDPNEHHPRCNYGNWLAAQSETRK